ncbi:Solute carrier organic anion transporter family member 4C1, partial [Galemys pyrenaicus]
TCLTTRNSTSCASSSSSLSNYLYVFILGQLLLGTGGTPLYTLGTAFLDDSVPTHKSSLYIGVGYAMSILGPAIGYVLGGQLLTIIDITEDDPRWLGAWWIGFLLVWIFAWSLILPFSCFPKHLPEALVTTGFATFLPKFIENQFGLSSSFAATLGGTIPGPIIFGVTIDSTCVLWDINECGIKGACWIYNNTKMAYMLVTISVICKIITIFFNGFAVFLYKPPPSGTDVSFQNENSVMTTVSLECDLNKAGNEG